MTRLPLGELKGASEQDDDADRDRYGARQRWPLHHDDRQSDGQRKRGHSEHCPDEEITRADKRGSPTEARLASPARSVPVAPQHRKEGWEHHGNHHRQPHRQEYRRRGRPGLSRHPHPGHGHCPTARHFHSARHRAEEINGSCHAGSEREGTNHVKFSRQCGLIAASGSSMLRHIAGDHEQQFFDAPLPYSSWRRNHAPIGTPSSRPFGVRSRIA